MKTTINVAVISCICLAVLGCKKYNEDYKDYLDNKEITYPGLATKVGYHAGNLRTVLFWNPSPDPSVKSYLITWNNGVDSMVVNATSNDPAVKMSVSVPGLMEYVYSFKIVARDAAGNKSVGQELNNVRVYGPAFAASLTNRPHDPSTPFEFNSDGSLKLNFTKADSTNYSTVIKYTNVSGATEERVLLSDAMSINIPNYKLGTAVQYKSSFKPERTAADAFFVNSYSEFPEIFRIVEMDKSKFQALSFPTDIRSEYGWELRYLWDNKKEESQGAGFHTGGSGMPQWFGIDLGAQTTLNSFRLWQRSSALYNVGNLKRFEVWGSNNPNTDGSWESWTKLTTFNSFKPSGQPAGQNSAADIAFAAAGEQFTFPAGLPNYRYVRFKVLETWGVQGYMHLMELTFYKKE
ncbi:DUF5000 domain-containing lipoprotein [Pedobacter psychroterrae]|nr:DUF5000 domain-containing lipoprotein [Pedobacter psychroterrae]